MRLDLARVSKTTNALGKRAVTKPGQEGLQLGSGNTPANSAAGGSQQTLKRDTQGVGEGMPASHCSTYRLFAEVCLLGPPTIETVDGCKDRVQGRLTHNTIHPQEGHGKAQHNARHRANSTPKWLEPKWLRTKLAL